MEIFLCSSSEIFLLTLYLLEKKSRIYEIILLVLKYKTFTNHHRNDEIKIKMYKLIELRI